MVDMYVYQGYWWLPDEPDNKVVDILQFDPDEGASCRVLLLLGGNEVVIR
jgi:hypothetical protein